MHHRDANAVVICVKNIKSKRTAKYGQVRESRPNAMELGGLNIEIGRTLITGINRSILLPPYQVIDHLRLESRSWISDFCNKF